jgi:tetratricopeptide (TPR) repeat protein
VPVYDVGSDEDLHWYAMELVEGASLAELLEQARGATEPSGSDSRHRRALGIRPSSTYANEAAAVVAELAHALTHAHEHGLLHRDVKPGNVMISGERVLLLDFGLAKDLEKESLSRTGDFAGTPHYMSPEQASGSRELDARSDIFSLGVLLYEMLTLRRPFEADTTHALMARIAHADPVPPRRLQPGIPRELETICLKALERNPEARYPSAQDFAKDLQRFLTHEPIQARAPGAVTRTWKLARRKPAATTAAVLAFLLLASHRSSSSSTSKVRATNYAMSRHAPKGARQEAVSLLDQLRTEKARTDQARKEAEESLSQLRSEQTRREKTLERAELYLGKAREIVDRMLQRASRGQIRATPAMAELYEGMLDDTLNFYRDFVAAQPDDPALRRTAAESLQSIGKVQRLLGRSAASKASFDKALELYESVRGAGIGEPEIRNRIAGLLGDQAQVQIQLGQREEAMKLVQRSLAEYQKMEQDFPDAPWRERALLGTISAQTNLATLLMRDARKLDEALRLHQEAIAAFDRVPKEDRQVPPFANKEAQTRNNFGALLLRAGKPTEARRELDAAMEIRARVVATHSDAKLPTRVWREPAQSLGAARTQRTRARRRPARTRRRDLHAAQGRAPDSPGVSGVTSHAAPASSPRSWLASIVRSRPNRTS